MRMMAAEDTLQRTMQKHVQSILLTLVVVYLKDFLNRAKIRHSSRCVLEVILSVWRLRLFSTGLRFSWPMLCAVTQSEIRCAECGSTPYFSTLIRYRRNKPYYCKACWKKFGCVPADMDTQTVRWHIEVMEPGTVSYTHLTLPTICSV